MNLMLLFMDKEEMMGPDFQFGLSQFKELAETPLPEPESVLDGEGEAVAEADA